MDRRISLLDLINEEHNAVKELNRLIDCEKWVIADMELHLADYREIGAEDRYVMDRMSSAKEYRDQIPDALQACEAAKSAIMSYFSK